MEIMKRVLAVFMVLALTVTSIPAAFITEAYAATGSADTRVADGSTLDDWKKYFGENDNNFSTQYSGHVWTDKTVMKDASAFSNITEHDYTGNTTADKITLDANDSSNFLVALSAMASSKSVKGETNKPTDTMIVLDLSSSMYNGSAKETNAVKTMVNAVNDLIEELQTLNVNNRVGVTIYYGGPDLLQAPANCYQLWLPLDRYTHSSNVFLKMNTSSGKITSVGVNTNVKNSSGKTVSASRTVPDISGTYMQQGILSALAQFQKADTYVPATAEVNPGMPRTPVMIFMTDGEPTAATNLYTQLDKPAILGSNRVDIRNPNEADFVTQLTAAYAKAVMDNHYKEETPLFYTLGVKVKAQSTMSYDVIDPSDTLGVSGYNPSTKINSYWESIVKNGSVKINYKNAPNSWQAAENLLVSGSATVTSTFVGGKTFPSSTAQRQYVDKAYLAENVDAMTDAFKSIFTDISLQTHTYPTLVEDNENLDGYVSFVDKIGKYMNVTDIKGIIMGEKLYSGEEFSLKFKDKSEFSSDIGKELIKSINARLGITDAETIIGLAHDNGQINYGNGTFSNYLGWYSDAAGKYLGFWHEGVTNAPENAVSVNKSYFFLGEAGAKSDMMYTSVRYTTNIETGEESIAFGVPAALIPTVEYNVELNEKGIVEKLTRGGAKSPIRLVYEVALSDEINELTVYDPDVVDTAYINAKDDSGNLVNVNADGSVNFFTNQYEANLEVGYNKVNSYSYFRPSRQNESYYYQENATVYSAPGTVYTGAKPSANGTFYRELTIYEKENGTAKKDVIYIEIADEVLATADSGAGNTWYIPSGDVFLNVSGYLNSKGNENYTNTLPNANNPFVDIYDHQADLATHRFVVGDTLGNNGKVTVVPQTGLKITKTVENGTNPDVEFEFTITSTDETDGKYSFIKYAKDGTASEGEIQFAGGIAVIKLKDGESVVIIGLSAGNKYTVSETETKEYILTGTTVNGNSADFGEVTLEQNKIASVGFTNAPRGEGTLTVAKLLEYPAGVSADIENKEFTINVKFEGVAVKDGDTFTVKHTGDPNTTTVTLANGSFDVKLKNGESAEISGIPEGTLATVTEILEQDSVFKFEKYIVNGTDSSNGAVEIKKAPTIDSVVVVNKYEPAPVQVDINLSGVKSLVDESGNAAAWPANTVFNFILQEYDAAAGKWVDKKSIDVVDTNGGKIEINESLSFGKVGTYGYQVIEKNHGFTIDGIVYDSTMHTFNVVVTDEDLDGKLEADVHSSHNTNGTSTFVFANEVWSNTSINFTNTNKQKSTSVPIMVRKVLLDPAESPLVSAAGFEFELYEMSSDFTAQVKKVATSEKTDAAGETYFSLNYDYGTTAGTTTHYYQIKEVVPQNVPAGMTYSEEYYDFSVEVTRAADGSVTAVVTPIETSGDTNSKKIMRYTEDGSGVEYQLAVFTNSYAVSEVKVPISVEKIITGKDLRDGEFSFTIDWVNAPAGTVYSETVSNTAAAEGMPGKVPFTDLVFDKVGTYKYTVKEDIPNSIPEGYTYDETVYEIIITVTDGENVTDNQGQTIRKLVADVDVLTVAGDEMLFENTYIPKPVEVPMDGTKTLYGKDLTAGQFNFVLTECDENWAPLSGGISAITPNTADGKFAFDALVFDEEGTYYFTVKENIPVDENGNPLDSKGVKYDTSEYKVVIEVKYDKSLGVFSADKTVTVNGNTVSDIAFYNEYEAEPVGVTIYGFKEIDGRDIAADGTPTFTFELYESDDKWNIPASPIATADSDTSGSFFFDLGEFDKEETHYYVVKEKIPDNVPAGYTYDTGKFGVVVDITDNLEGNYVSSVAYKKIELVTDDAGNTKEEATDVTDIIFTNIYEITGTTEITLEGIKYIEDKVLTNGTFTFVLANEKMEGITQTRNNPNGTFSFTIEYAASEVGTTYTYYIFEKNDNQGGIIYDSTLYKVVVDVLDNNEGGVTTKVTVNGEDYDPDKEQIKFVNRIHIDPPEDPKKPQDNEEIIATGGDMNISLIAAVSALSAIGIAVSFAAGKKKK